MKYSLSSGVGRYAFSRRSILFLSLLCFVALSGFQCGDDVDVPDAADVGGPGYNVGIAFGSPGTNSHYPGTGDPCLRFTGGIYKIKKVVVEVFRFDANGNEVLLYPRTIFKDGVNFSGGNPNSPKGSGMKYQVPLYGAYKVRVRVYGYSCDELPNPEDCLDCCEGDETAVPFWEEVSDWKSAKEDNMAYAYISHPLFKYCI